MKMLTVTLMLLLIVSAGIWFQSANQNEVVTLPNSLSAIDESTVPDEPEASIIDGSSKKPFVEIENPSGFVNTDGKPFKIADYIGTHVILLDVMTYSCINCQRTFPYVNTWYETYRDDGFIVIGIHTPEFAFEKDIANVEKAFSEFGITFPTVLDNDYATWRALGNRYWPRMYLIDIHGNIVYDHIGEGAYDETEAKIKALLKEREAVLQQA